MTLKPKKLDVPFEEPQDHLDPWQSAQDPFKVGSDSEGGAVKTGEAQPTKTTGI